MSGNRCVRATAVMLCAAAGIAASAFAGAAPHRVLHTTLEGHPTAVVPGRVGIQFRNFWRPYVSPGGATWVMRANYAFFDSGSMLIVGEADGKASALLVQDDLAPWVPPGAELISTIDEQMGVNNAGQIAFSSNTNGGPNETDEYVIRLNSIGATWDIVAQEGQAIAAVPGATYGVILDETHILSDGTVCLRSINSPGLPSDEDTLLLRGATLVAREGVTVPSGQILGAVQPWDNFDFHGYSHDQHGAAHMIIGDLEGDSNGDNVVTANGVTRIQEGAVIQPLPSPTVSTPGGFADGSMAPNGDWYARGSNSGGVDWVVRNGAVLTTTDRTIFPSAPAGSESWDDSVPNTTTFFCNTGNFLGDYVIGGYTNNANAAQNAVVQLNQSEILLRRGDMLDLNGNGMADDDLFIADFEVDKAALTAGRRLLIVVRAQNAAGTLDEQTKALLLIGETVCPADLDGDGMIGAGDLAILLGAWGTTAADLTGDGNTNAADLALLLGAWGECV